METVDLWRWYGMGAGGLLILQIVILKLCYYRHFRSFHPYLATLALFVIGLIAVTGVELYLKLEEPATWRVYTHCILFAVGQIALVLLTVEVFLKR